MGRQEVKNVELADRITTHLKNNGYLIADLIAGNIVEDIAKIRNPHYCRHYWKNSIDHIGIGRDTGYGQLRYSKPWIVGDLWIDNSPRKASPENNWVMEFYGVLNLPKIKRTLGPLAEEMGVSIEWKCPLSFKRVPMEGMMNYLRKYSPELASTISDAAKNLEEISQQ